MENKRGWIEIVEAFVAILLVVGVVLVVVNNQTSNTDISDQVYKVQVSILREIELNDTMRADILNAGDVPINWDDSNFPSSVKNTIIERTPGYLNCTAKICDIADACSMQINTNKNVYSQPVTISSTLQGVGYRKLNLFCITK